MKPLLLQMLLGLAVRTAYAQVAAPTYASLPTDSTTHQVTYTAVVPVPGASQVELSQRAHEWAARTFLFSQLATQLDDPATGTYLLRGSVPQANGTRYTYLLAIYARDGRYKYVLDQLHYAYSVRQGNVVLCAVDEPAEHWATRQGYYVTKRVREVQAAVAGVVKDLTAAMTVSPAAQAKW